MMQTVTADTISLERLREFLAAAELLADNEIDMILPNENWSFYSKSLKRSLTRILARREAAVLVTNGTLGGNFVLSRRVD